MSFPHEYFLFMLSEIFCSSVHYSQSNHYNAYNVTILSKLKFSDSSSIIYNEFHKLNNAGSFSIGNNIGLPRQDYHSQSYQAANPKRLPYIDAQLSSYQAIPLPQFFKHILTYCSLTYLCHCRHHLG